MIIFLFYFKFPFHLIVRDCWIVGYICAPYRYFYLEMIEETISTVDDNPVLF